MKSYQTSIIERAARWLPVSLLCSSFSLACGSAADGVSPTKSTNATKESAGEATSRHGGSAPTSERRVVGYMPTWRLHNSPALDFSTLTHLNLSFANTVEDGSIDFAPEDRDVVSAVIARAKQSGVKVLASVGGGTPNAGKDLQGDVTVSVDKLLALVAKYGLDGIDIDIEGDAINEAAYPKLLDLLSQKLPSELVLSAAVAEYRKDSYGSLDKADFLSVMSYDKCGSFNGGVACEQSPYADARDQLAYWAKRTAADRVVLGMPFFARCWGAACDTRDKCKNPIPPVTAECENVIDYSYAELLSSKFASRATCQPDLIQGEGYYVSLNGPATIASKVALAGRYGGVMIWELGQDTRDGYLFSVVRNALNGVQPQCDAPAPAADDVEKPTADDGNKPAPAVDDGEKPNPAIDDGHQPAPASDDSDSGTPAADNGEKPIPAADDGDEPAPAADDGTDDGDDDGETDDSWWG